MNVTITAKMSTETDVGAIRMRAAATTCTFMTIFYRPKRFSTTNQTEEFVSL